MKIQNNPHSFRILKFVTSELFSSMLDIAAAYDSYGYQSYCVIVLARNARVSRDLAQKTVRAEIQRRRPSSSRSWAVSNISAGGAV